MGKRTDGFGSSNRNPKKTARTVLQNHVHERVPLLVLLLLLLLLLGLAAVLEEGLRADGQVAGDEEEILLDHVGVLLLFVFGWGWDEWSGGWVGTWAGGWMDGWKKKHSSTMSGCSCGSCFVDFFVILGKWMNPMAFDFGGVDEASLF